MNEFIPSDSRADTRSDSRRPLLVSSSLQLIDEVVRLASSAALEVQVAPDLTTATRHWLDAPLVIIGSDITGTADLPGKRARVIVVDAQDGDDTDADTARQRDMWRFAVEVGVDLVIDSEGVPWLVEVNSRPRGRMEALAAADPGRFLDAHVAACGRPIAALAWLARNP